MIERTVFLVLICLIWFFLISCYDRIVLASLSVCESARMFRLHLRDRSRCLLVNMKNKSRNYVINIIFPIFVFNKTWQIQISEY